MLQAIDSARDHICLTTYIFDTDETGRRFIDALGRAVERGVTVRVLIDGVGEWYSWPRASSLLRKIGRASCRERVERAGGGGGGQRNGGDEDWMCGVTGVAGR